ARTQLPEGVAVDRFAVSPAFDTQAMVYREAPGGWADYPYHHWRARPGEMVSDYLARDLAASGWFALAAWPDLPNRARFRLSGILREFYENDGPGAWEAVLTLDLVLTDQESRNLTDRVLFQQTYHAVFPAGEKTPQAVARAMGQCLMNLSGQVGADVYEAVSLRLASSSP
ncbi:MAG: ABC-type transport auxiliary lipoprotein family protein, partial [Pseudomonadota bacterium]